MRCLALGQRWRRYGGQVAFITASDNHDLCCRLSDQGFQVTRLERAYPDPGDWATTRQILAEAQNTWMVLDGYHFDTAYQQQIKQAGHRLLVIDDLVRLDHYSADLVLDQNVGAEQEHYPCGPCCRLLLGTRYALLRSEFLAWRGWQREIPKTGRKVLVTLGGSDPKNQTQRIVQALQRVEVKGLEIAVIVGPNTSQLDHLRLLVQNSARAVRLAHDVKNMAEFMTWADVAVSGGGSTCWELAFLGLPNAILTLADNQRKIAKGLDTLGVAINLG
jgi:UDP-2,4-diacetamido-2,4,6-trideoxy-beta-L-altropyranose hydrolase